MPFYDLRWGATPSAVMREGEWKLIEYFGDWVDLDSNEYKEGHRLELYQLSKDLSERNNLADQQPERARQMRQRLHAWIRSCGAEVPMENPRHDRARAFEETRDKRLAGLA
jgi:hypothetical protein